MFWKGIFVRELRKMDTGGSKRTRSRELPPLPQRGPRALPTMPSQDSAVEAPAQKRRKKKGRKETSGVEDNDDPGTAMGRRESEDGDLTFDQTTDAAPQRRRKRKKAPTVDVDDDQTDLVNRDAVDQTADAEEVGKLSKKKKRSKAMEPQTPDDEFSVEEEDVVSSTPPPVFQHPVFAAPHGPSQPVGKVFVERNKRFQAAERSDWRKANIQTENMADFNVQPLCSPRDVALRVHRGYRVLGLYCHGLLAGFALWNAVVVYALAGQQLSALTNLLQQYHGLAYPAQSLLYLLLALSTVAAFDRVNLAKGSVALQEFITLNPVALASFLYFSALVLSLSQQMTSDRINLYPDSNATLWPPGSEHQILHPWVTVNVVVALLVGLAWVLIATRPETDFTHDYLDAMRTEPPKQEDQSEMTA